MELQGTTDRETVATDPPLRARTPVFGHAGLTGTFRTKLEGNGRLVIPAPLKAPYVALGAGQLLVVDTALWFLTHRAFELNVETLLAENADLLAEDHRTLLYNASFEASVDKQARIVIPPEMRKQVDLEGEHEIVVTGSVDHLEVWRAEEWDRERAGAVAQAGLAFKRRRTLPTGGA